MKRSCPFCNVRLSGKALGEHIFLVHQGAGREFFCRDGCVRCCTDVGAPLELLLEDIQRISASMGITCEEFFRRYGDVHWTMIPGTRSLIPATCLPFPCSFLSEGRCSIYELRPLHCRLFPERLYVKPSPAVFEPFYRSGYVCVDEGVYLTEERMDEVARLMEEDRRELERTARFFRNEEFIYELSPEEVFRIESGFGEISSLDPERNRKRREIVEGVIPESFKALVRESFLSRLREIDRI